MSTLPFLPAPTKASKKWNPSPRSSRMKNCEEAMNGDVLMYQDRKSTRLNSSHGYISYAVFCLKKKNRRDAHLLVAAYHQPGSHAAHPPRPAITVAPGGAATSRHASDVIAARPRINSQLSAGG